MNLTFEWDRSQIQPLRDRGLERALLSSLRKSGGDAIRAMRAASNRSIRFRKNMKAGAVSKGLVLRMPRSTRSIEDLEWRVDVSGSPFPLSAYPARQVGARVRGRKGRKEVSAGGVRVSVNKGRASFVQGAFIAKLKSGHRGIFVRRGLKRLPIDELFSTRISDVFRDNGMIPAVFARGSTVFSASMGRLLPLEIAKHLKK